MITDPYWVETLKEEGVEPDKIGRSFKDLWKEERCNHCGSLLTCKYCGMPQRVEQTQKESGRVGMIKIRNKLESLGFSKFEYNGHDTLSAYKTLTIYEDPDYWTDRVLVIKKLNLCLKISPFIWSQAKSSDSLGAQAVVKPLSPGSCFVSMILPAEKFYSGQTATHPDITICLISATWITGTSVVILGS